METQASYDSTLEIAKPTSRSGFSIQASDPATRKQMLLTGIAALILGAVSFYGYHSYMYVSTDNAMIEAKTTLLAPRVGGLIVGVSVTENQAVKAGQVLAKIRPIEYQNALNQAQAEQASLAAQLRSAESSYRRIRDLLKQGAATQERFDLVESQYRSLNEKLRAATSAVEQAKVNLDDTEIKAPADGKIAKKSVEIGMMTTAGQPILGFVEGSERWATANFKETEMRGIVPGKTVNISVDAISGRSFEGVVESISPSTGATFSLLPPDNATGNFTKVVQRVPVRVKLVHLTSEDIELLQAGLSADVTVKLH